MIGSNPKELEVLWNPDGASQSETPREGQIKRIF